ACGARARAALAGAAAPAGEAALVRAAAAQGRRPQPAGSPEEPRAGAALEAENARLREEIRAMYGTIKQQSSALSQLWEGQLHGQAAPTPGGARVVGAVAEISRVRLGASRLDAAHLEKVLGAKGSTEASRAAGACTTPPRASTPPRSATPPRLCSAAPCSQVAEPFGWQEPATPPWAATAGSAPQGATDPDAIGSLVGSVGRFPSGRRLPLFTLGTSGGAASASPPTSAALRSASPAGAGGAPGALREGGSPTAGVVVRFTVDKVDYGRLKSRPALCAAFEAAVKAALAEQSGPGVLPEHVAELRLWKGSVVVEATIVPPGGAAACEALRASLGASVALGALLAAAVARVEGIAAACTGTIGVKSVVALLGVPPGAPAAGAEGARLGTPLG
ncbi:unnamed protein product, partial [Prorocentrum cordatum]